MCEYLGLSRVAPSGARDEAIDKVADVEVCMKT